jgi:hypothetical protein
MDIANIVDSGIVMLAGGCLILVSKGKISHHFKDPEMANSSFQKAIYWIGVLAAVSGVLDLFGVL